MRLSSLKGFARDALLALGIAFLAWFLWVQFLMPQPRRSGPAPPFQLHDLTGQEVRLSDHADDLVILNFWFTSCPPCRHEIPQLAAFHEENPELPLYGISVDRMDTRRLERYARKLGINYPVLHDPEGRVAQAYGVSLFPTTVVIRRGEIAAVRMGEVTQRSLEKMIERVR